MKLFLGFCFTLSSLFSVAQDLFIKSHSATSSQSQYLQIETFDDGGFVVAGNDTPSLDSSTIFLRKFNPCGEELWSKQISDATMQVYLTELNIDSNQNIVITARKSVLSQNPLPILIKVNSNGNLIYSKVLNSVLGYNSLSYSSSIAPNGDYYIFGIYRYEPLSPSFNKYFVSRFNPNGNIIWTKNLTAPSSGEGRMLATKDGGIVCYFSNKIVKLDSLGNKEWAKDYSNFHTLITPIETDSGYVFAWYFIGALDRGGVFSIRKDGSVGWVTDRFINFFPYRGITRKNGNVFFPGKDPLSFSTNTVFLELDYRNGNIAKSSKVQGSVGYFPIDVSENKNNELYFAGPDNRGVVPQLITGKLNDTLSTLSCTTGIVNAPNDPFSVTELNDNPLTTINNTDFILNNLNLIISSLSFNTGNTECAFTKPRGSVNLGADTVLCFGQSVLLGNSTSDFDSYLWSTNSTNNTIDVNKSGTYWLQVVSACDTLRDSITIINVVSPTQPILGNDTLLCHGEQLELKAIEGIQFKWSTNEQSKFILVGEGVHWLEYFNECDTLRDSINVLYSTKLKPIINLSHSIINTFDTLLLFSENSGSLKSTWNFGDGVLITGDTIQYSFQKSGNYKITLTVTDSNKCTSTTFIQLLVKLNEYFAPNIFTPNDDYINDEFKPIGKDVKTFKMQIFNRWGELVFNGDDVSWNGRMFNGSKLDNGNYLYIIELEFFNLVKATLKGEVSLLR